MKIIIFDEGLRPITVIEVRDDTIRAIETGARPRYLRFPVPEFSCESFFNDNDKLTVDRISYVVIDLFEIFYKNEKTKTWVGVVADSEKALNLPAKILPGQLSTVLTMIGEREF